MFCRKLRDAVVFFSFSLIFCAVLVYAQFKHAPVSALRFEGPRPLLAALEHLQARKGWMFHYEEPVWKFAGDMIADPALSRGKSPEAIAALPRVLRRTVLDLEFLRTRMEAPDADADALISEIVAAYSRTNAVAHYEVRKAEDKMWMIVPRSSTDATGEPNDAERLLDTVIRVPEKKRTPLDTLRAIAEEISIYAGIYVEPFSGIIDIGGFDSLYSGTPRFSRPGVGDADSPDITWGVEQQPARLALLDFISKSKTTLRWALLCQPAISRTDTYCVLNLDPVTRESVDSSGQISWHPIHFDRGEPRFNRPPPPPPGHVENQPH